MTGGTITERRDIPEDSRNMQVLVGESFRASAEGGRVRDVSEGDIVVIRAACSTAGPRLRTTSPI